MAELSLKEQCRIWDCRNVQGMTIHETVSETGFGIKSVEKYGKGERPRVTDPIEQAKKRAEQDAQRREHVEAVKELAFRSTLRDCLSEVAKTLEPPPAYRPIKSVRGEVVETMLLHLSDWHADELVRAENVFGLNEYSRSVMDRRIAKVVASTVEIKSRLESGGYRFPTLVVAANGDMVSGTIHEVERHTDGPNILRTALRCATSLAAAIRDLSGSFERIHVFGTSGNHGRLGDAKKVQTKDPTRSWDYLIYEYAAALLKDCPNVTVECPDSWAVMYELEGKLFYQGHGHFVKSWNSIPFYGINRMTSRLGAVIAKHFRPVDYWLFGHFHVHGSIENAGGEYLINPPLIGPQEFGVHSFGDAVPPGQSLFGVHQKYGITHRWRLAAEEVWPPTGKGLRTTKIKSGR
jgi:hypothetical protein